MRIDMQTISAWKRDLAALKTRPANDKNLEALLAFRRSLNTTVRQLPGAIPSEDSIKKAELISEKLAITTIDLPPDPPEQIKQIAAHHEGRLWTLDVIGSMEAELASVTRDVERQKERIAMIAEEVAGLRKKLYLLTPYISLMNALAQRGPGAQRSLS